MIALLVVNYRSAALAVDAIRSARAATAAPLQVIVVDNSVDRREADVLRAHCDILLTPDKNLGYAGGINAGRAQCRAEIVIVSNPDVVFGAGSIDTLARAFDDPRVAVAGPSLYWDDGFTWMLPPNDLPSFSLKLDEVLASRSAAWARRRDRRRIAQRIRFWSLTDQVEAGAISGAVMAIRVAAFDEIGGFDERFPLYFEETDFLRRMASHGKRIVYVPTARCRHMYNQSAGSDSHNASRAYAESEMLYLSKWYGRFTARLLKGMERPRRVPEPARLDGPIPVNAADALVEASPLPSFDTAAGHFATSQTVKLPDEVWSSYLSSILYVRVIDRLSRHVVGTWAKVRT
ncbi:MAG TPA: glycosyltransferase family 2 protein [Thermoanaerobaculia bacterium]